MSNLEKLIEQYEKETGKKAFELFFLKTGDKDETKYTQGFVHWLVSRPTCGVEQRKFLDQIETKFELKEWTCDGNNKTYHDLSDDFENYLSGYHLTCDLRKVYKGE